MRRKREVDVAVVGAGPVGLLNAISLKTNGVDVQIYDEGQRTVAHSYACVLHPSTLRLLDRFGIAGDCMSAGRVVTAIGVYDGVKQVAEIDLSRLPGAHPHTLVLPQFRLEAILQSALKHLGVTVQWGHRVQGFESANHHVQLAVAKLDKVSTGYPIAHTEVVVDKVLDVEAKYVVGADGYDSFVRRRAGIEMTSRGKEQLYSVFQLADVGDVPANGRLMVAGDDVAGYWPLPGGRCRFSFPIASQQEHRADAGRLAELLSSFAPWFSDELRTIEWTALGMFERKLATSFGNGRVWLAGDAAHLTGPLGGQSMNVGLHEADDLAARIGRMIRPGFPDGLLDDYNATRAAEWHTLLGSQVTGVRRSILLSCLPASGSDLNALLDQLS